MIVLVILAVLLFFGAIGMMTDGAGHGSTPGSDLLPVAGVSFRQPAVLRCRPGDPLQLRLDPFGAVAAEIDGSHPHDDPDAVLVLHDGEIVGYIPRRLNGPICANLRRDGDAVWQASVVRTVGGSEGYHAGLRIRVFRQAEHPDATESLAG